MKGYGLDPHPEANAAQQHYAVVFAPKRRARGRFPANNVKVCDSIEAAIEGHEPEQKMFAAQVIGPSKSSEGCMIYYLVRWLVD